MLYWGLNRECFQRWKISDYVNYLNQKPEISTVQSDESFSPYPDRGIIPEINDNGLEFLHPDIKEACLCLGRFYDNIIETKCLGINALSNEEYWSSTKIMSLLHFLYSSSQKYPQGKVRNYLIEGLTNDRQEASLFFKKVAQDMISSENDYVDNEAYSSNSLASMLKRFGTREELETLLRDITGNQTLTLWGSYGENPFVDQPQLINSSSQEVIIQTLARDPARLTDLAIDVLGISEKLDNVVILSKLGNGATSFRKRTEAVYVAFIQAIDTCSNSGKPITLTMALRGGLALKNRYNEEGEYNQDVLEQERVELDARMATEVTKILERVLNNKF